MHPDITAAKSLIESKLGNRKPTIGIILGSGLNEFAERLENPVRIAYGNIPGFRPSSVPGHTGQFVAGTLHGKALAVLQGRVHCYEGYSASEVTFPVRALGAIGVKTLMVTCAAGGITGQLRPGALMMIEDHINLMGDNPLVGGAFQEN